MEISVTKIRQMGRLMKRLTDKTFDKDDLEQLADLSAHFLYVSKAIPFVGSYSLKDDTRHVVRSDQSLR